jgi:flagellar protein FliO/FliZ
VAIYFRLKNIFCFFSKNDPEVSRLISFMLRLAVLAPVSALAADPARPFASPTVVQTATPPGVGSLGQVTLSLGLVLAVIFAAAWIVRRMRGFNRAGSGALDVIADLPLGQKERAVLVRVGKQQILIGVAPGRVSTLHVLSEPVEIATPPSSPTAGPGSAAKPNFKALLMKSLGK